MPDIAAALKFQKKIITIEKDYLKQIGAYRQETRRVLLEIIDRGGVSRTAVAQMQKEIDFLGRKVSTLAGVAGNEVRKTVGNYTRKQVQLAERVGLTDNADIAPVLRLGEPIVKDATEAYMTSESAWVAQLQTSLQVQSAKLRIGNASSEEISDRLISERLADGRASVWAMAGVQAAKEETQNLWAMAGGLVGGYLALFNETQSEVNYQKQAIAAIDERTTDCCLRVHGQIQPLDEPFQLDGTPRYADEVQDPPFHWYCRSSETLYEETFEEIGIPTSEMEDAAAAELKAREDGTRQEIHPSHATSRRTIEIRDQSINVKQFETVEFTEDEKFSLFEYTQDSYKDINTDLRDGKPLSEDNQFMVDRINDVFDRTPGISEETTVYRGANFTQGFLDALQEGSVFQDNAFVSTSLSRDIARVSSIKGDNKPVIMEITLPRGTRVINMDLSDNQFAYEKERLLQSGSQFRVVSVDTSDEVVTVFRLELEQ
jgi:hypothetical protein